MSPRAISIFLVAVFLPGLPAFADAAKDKYEKVCASCHGMEGHADTKKGKKMKAADYREVAELKGPDAVEHIKKTVRENKKHKLKFRGSDADLETLATWLASLGKQ